MLFTSVFCVALSYILNLLCLLRKAKKQLAVAVLLVWSSLSANGQTPLYSQVLISDVGSSNSIGSANTSRNLAVDAQGNIGVVYVGSAGLRFAKSVNRGQSFLPSVQLSTATTGDCEVEVADNGNVYVIYSNGSQISLFVSLDGGATFSGPNVLGPGAIPHIASYGSNVYVVPKVGSPVYRNSNNGVGTFSTVTFPTKVYADIRIDKANGYVYLIQDDPRLYMFRSTDNGATFSSVPINGSVNYSSYSITTGPLGKYIYVAGAPTAGYRVDFTTGASTSIPVGTNSVSEGRTLASDEFGNFIDGYAQSGSTMAFKVSNDLGASFGTPITIDNATSHNIARNSSTQDIDVVYRGTDGKIYLNVYGDLLAGLTISQVGHTYCPGTTGTVNYSMTGLNVNSSNQFVVQLSDANRSFASPQIIGTIASAARTGSINVEIPATIAFGSNYRMRVVSTDVATNGSDNAFDVDIQPNPTATIMASGPITFCEGQSVVLSANLLNSSTSYLWSNGATGRSITVSTSGSYSCTITTPCGSITSTPVAVSVYHKPTSEITADGSTSFCEDGRVTLTATSDSPIDSYLWSTGATSPSIIATTAGNYTVTVTNICGTTTSAPLLITKAPAASITALGPTTFCSGNSVELVAISDGKLDTYLWNTGATTKSIIVTTGGNYSVKVSNICGLSTNSAAETVTVKPLPIVDFNLPDACLTDGVAQFTNTSSLSDAGALTYAWSFGDNNANPQRPNTSTDKDPIHIYSASGIYQVTLTATAANGCSASTTKTYTVSASVPKADFTILSTNTLCSDQPVLFEDKATLSFGEITRIEWHFDINNHPADPLFQLVDNNPNPRASGGKQYSFAYPIFHMPSTKTVNVKMRAFSGATCVGEIIKPLTLKAVPDIVFDPIPDICSEKAPIQLTQAYVAGGLPGTGEYSGNGVSASGLFQPQVAGVGIHTITYTFACTNGCIGQKSETISVFATPLVGAGPDERILLDDYIQLNPTASGNNLSYKWTPSTGLDKDDVRNPVASPKDDITYTLTITSSDGCTASDDLFIKVLKLPEVPNTFTPNGDGVNDTWIVKNLDSYPNASVEIFNRFGTQVYTARGFLKPWDGKMNGADLPAGTYYYKISPGMGRKVIAGQITILK
ncbi:MAG: hypothetical protein K0S09_3081 [Sphingobacteriaceae bacterium]|jgi:gliding motility-associated-like protein|nr:hypothetical protein [Sphingobacteriaceae bacterium]